MLFTNFEDKDGQRVTIPVIEWPSDRGEPEEGGIIRICYEGLPEYEAFLLRKCFSKCNQNPDFKKIGYKIIEVTCQEMQARAEYRHLDKGGLPDFNKIIEEVNDDL